MAAKRGDDPVDWILRLQTLPIQRTKSTKGTSIPKPTLESIVWAARSAGVRKMRQEPEVSHPARPHAKEGRLVMPPSHVLEVMGASSKEGVMQKIGTILRRRSKRGKGSGEGLSKRPC